VEPPSARPWLGVGAALSALPASGGCFCAALVLAVVADSDPGAVYEQHRWLGAVVAASAVCAFVAMMGWATLRHGGLPAPVLLMALVLAGAPFLLPRGLFIPAVVIATAGSAGLARFGLARPPASLDATKLLIGALAGAAFALAVGQAIAVGIAGAPPKAKVLSSQSKAEPAPRVVTRRHHARKRPDREPSFVPPSKSPPAKPGGTDAAPAEAAPEAPAPAAPAPEETSGEPTPAPEAAAPVAAAPEEPVATAPEELGTPADDVSAAAEEFVRSYYAALDGRQYEVAWNMLNPELRSGFGAFARWRKGYRTTISHSPGGIHVSGGPDETIVELTLRAGDRDACGNIIKRRWAVTWRLVRTDAGLRAAAATARKLAGPDPC
jgi:hypothetical protein